MSSTADWPDCAGRWTLAPADVVAEVTDSGLRGRGGAGFPAGIKWKTVLDTPGPLKFICCNADEGDSGTFADRMLMEGDPFTLIEGMTIAAHAVGATEGYIYIRSEYPDAVRTLRQAIDIARAEGWLGEDILGSGLRFDLFVRVGAGAYICGEETAMLESLEGKRGMVRAKPPIPAITGLFGKPTVVNNVLTLGSVPTILADGAAAYQDLGVERSRGTQVFQLGRQHRPGRHVRDRLRHHPERTDRRLRRRHPVRPAGPRGAGRRSTRAYLPASNLDLPMDYEAFAAAGRDARPRRHRGLRRHRRHGLDGAVRDGVLRRGVLRQVHPVPGRCGTRRGGDRPHRRGRGPGREPGPAG